MPYSSAHTDVDAAADKPIDVTYDALPAANQPSCEPAQAGFVAERSDALQARIHSPATYLPLSTWTCSTLSRG